MNVNLTIFFRYCDDCYRLKTVRCVVSVLNCNEEEGLSARAGFEVVEHRGYIFLFVMPN